VNPIIIKPGDAEISIVGKVVAIVRKIEGTTPAPSARKL
jgi:hypothetical protein